jgi:hypothetical protein
MAGAIDFARHDTIEPKRSTWKGSHSGNESSLRADEANSAGTDAGGRFAYNRRASELGVPQASEPGKVGNTEGRRQRGTVNKQGS